MVPGKIIYVIGSGVSGHYTVSEDGKTLHRVPDEIHTCVTTCPTACERNVPTRLSLEGVRVVGDPLSSEAEPPMRLIPEEIEKMLRDFAKPAPGGPPKKKVRDDAPHMPSKLKSHSPHTYWKNRR